MIHHLLVSRARTRVAEVSMPGIFRLISAFDHITR